MKRVLYLAFAISVIGISCSKVVDTRPQLSKEEINRKADSIFTIKSKEIEEAGRNDLQYRLKIEVKARVDSMVNK